MREADIICTIHYFVAFNKIFLILGSEVALEKFRNIKESAKLVIML